MPHRPTIGILLALTVSATSGCGGPYGDPRRVAEAASAHASAQVRAALDARPAAPPAAGPPAATASEFASLLSREPRYPLSRPRWTPAAAPPPPPPAASAVTLARGLPAAMRDSLPPALLDSLPRRVLRSVLGEATFYADVLEGRRTASGTVFRQDQMVAAHRRYPFGTLLRVTNTRNDRSVRVRVVDRGPWGARVAARNTIIDLSKGAARQLGYLRSGRASVRVEVLEWGPGGDG